MVMQEAKECGRFKKQADEKSPLRLSGPLIEDARESHR
jgi:hypothetical protein